MILKPKIFLQGPILIFGTQLSYYYQISDNPSIKPDIVAKKVDNSSMAILFFHFFIANFQFELNQGRMFFNKIARVNSNLNNFFSVDNLPCKKNCVTIFLLITQAPRTSTRKWKVTNFSSFEFRESISSMGNNFVGYKKKLFFQPNSKQIKIAALFPFPPPH